MADDEITELRDLIPATIGIVDRGAIRRKFLVIKRALPFADLPVVDKPKPEETESELLDGLLGPTGDDWDAVASAFLWFDADAAKERGEPAREDYKLPIGRRDDDGTIRVYFEKVADALGILNGGRGGVDIPAVDKQRAFETGLQYYAKLNGQLPDDEQKELPEFTGIRRRDNMAKKAKQEDAEAAASFPTLTASAKEQLALVGQELAKLDDFENMGKDAVSNALHGIHSALWSADSNLVALAKRAGVVLKQDGEGDDEVMKASALGDFLRTQRDEAEMTNAELGEAADISESTVAQILSGEITRPPDDRLRGFARALSGVSFEQLVDLLPEALEDVRTEVRIQNNEADMSKISKQNADALAVAIPKIEEYADTLEDEEIKTAVMAALGMLKAPVSQQGDDDEDAVAMSKRWLEKADPAVREAFAALEKRAADAETVALDERDRRLTREAVSKAETDFDLLGDPITLGGVLKAAEEGLTADTYEKLLGVLKGANARAGENDALLREIGKRSPVNSDSAEGRVRALAKSMVENKTAKTVAQAIDAVLKANPELHAEYKAEQKADRS